MKQRPKTDLFKWLLVCLTILGMQLSVSISATASDHDSGHAITAEIHADPHFNEHSHSHEIDLNGDHEPAHNHSHNPTDHTHIVVGLINSGTNLQERPNKDAVPGLLHFSHLELIHSLKRPPRLLF